MKAAKNKYYKGGKEPLLNKKRRMDLMNGIMKDAEGLKKLLNEPVFINEIEEEMVFCSYCGFPVFDDDSEICNECFKMKFDDMNEGEIKELQLSEIK